MSSQQAQDAIEITVEERDRINPGALEVSRGQDNELGQPL